jgi:hypothetical protein
MEPRPNEKLERRSVLPDAPHSFRALHFAEPVGHSF